MGFRGGDVPGGWGGEDVGQGREVVIMKHLLWAGISVSFGWLSLVIPRTGVGKEEREEGVSNREMVQLSLMRINDVMTACSELRLTLFKSDVCID